MIKLERLNGDEFYVNALLIEQVQSHPDTTITLTSGKKIVVKTEEDEVIRKITTYYQKIGLTGTQENK
ncbi:MAG TPA: flagellar FlbD family protein [Pseudogracilibacillus sp.]|nr:flagellar FlbD family protein [Pseudogracilibacillus sp.]